MPTNGNPTTERLRDFNPRPFPDPPKPASLAKAQQAADEVATHVTLMQQKQQLDLERLMGKVAVLNQAKPIIETVIGDANHTLQQLTNVVIERGVDIAEDCVELTITDED